MSANRELSRNGVMGSLGGLVIGSRPVGGDLRAWHEFWTVYRASKLRPYDAVAVQRSCRASRKRLCGDAATPRDSPVVLSSPRKIRARRAEYSLTESALSPFQADLTRAYQKQSLKKGRHLPSNRALNKTYVEAAFRLGLRESLLVGDMDAAGVVVGGHVGDDDFVACFEAVEDCDGVDGGAA
jgi:hypothetical protein